MSRPPTSAPRPSQQTDRTAEQAAYEYLTNVLNTPWNAPIEIEILPPALQADEFAVRVLDNSIGVPYTLLSLAFQYARLLFSSGLPQAREQGLGRWEDFQHTMSCTKIMLLFDPTHVSAANSRKRLLLWLSDPSFLPQPSFVDEIIRHELWFLDSLQTSPLAKHTKSAILWQHRKWLLDEFLEWIMDVQRADVMGSKRMSVIMAPNETLGDNPIDPTEIFWRSFLEPELKTVSDSGQQHPLNYHAWDFARRLVDVMIDYSDLNDLDLSRLMDTTIRTTKDWCISHLSDTSGWSFLLYLLGRTGDDAIVANTFMDVGNQVVSYKYRQEPVWIFIRTILASDEYVSAEFRSNFVNQLSGWLEGELEMKKKIESQRAQAGNDDVGQRLQELPYFDVVMRHLKWIRNCWLGEPRPALFDPPPDQPQFL